MTDGPEERAASVALVFEYVDPSLLGMNLEAGDFPPLLQGCAGMLVACGVDTAKTRLVITGDFVRSVQDRGEPGSEYHENYNTQRNTGMVGGKTIPLPDSTVDVLLQAVMFVPLNHAEDAAAVAGSALHTVVHEAQHVVIAQHGEASGELEATPWARRNLLIAADQVIEEYRAELVACQVVGPSGWNTEDLVSSAKTWLGDLQRIATVEYQSHLDVGRLAYDILQESHTVWKLLGYAAAEQLEARDGLPTVVAEDELWTAMIEPHWEEFTLLLARVPGGDERIPRAELESLASDLADLFADWLVTLGFEFTDHPEGAAFYIRDWTLLALELD
ncbi:hypothetical protein [Occultella gossypii]|uniref:Uncharacterized protein n=1 Tax=Occultella gossypii TaxID=2800820 RepID=A0ABS7SFG3_9MICO|nr:hypothetical protein [Occultella gossypii]MBZ2198460.1 hypothetical protein [Occultella gossypii]